MGTLAGHLLPGTFFILFAMWWSFITSIRYIQSKMKSPFRKNSLVGYKGSVTMPCICLPCHKLKRAPVESYVKLIFATIGLIGELYTGIHRLEKPQPLIDNIFDGFKNEQSNQHEHMEHAGGNEHEHIHKRDVMVPSIPVKVWHMEYVNAQHSTMYSAFIFGAIIEILLYHRVDLPKRLDYVTGTFGFAVEAFLFANHLHSREPLDIHLHKLLVYAIYGCVLCCILEIYNPNQILFTYGRILFTFLQGTWFFEVGYILYPPYDTPFFKWDKHDHNQIMTVTMTYCWHVIFIMIGLLIQLGFMKFVYRNSKRISSVFDELIDIDENADQTYIHSEHNGIQTKFLSLKSDDEDSIDETVAFDSTKLIKSSKHKENIKMNDFENNSPDKSMSNSSSPSVISGTYSVNANFETKR